MRSGLFLLGDNRTFEGQDSRYFGEVNPGSCLGRAIMRLKPSDIESPIARGFLDILD